MLATLARRAASVAKTPLAISANPYKTKKVWPPDFSQLSPQEQFRFEKRYKRRVKLLAERPRWTRLVKLTQLFSITCESSIVERAYDEQPRLTTLRQLLSSTS